MVLERFERHAPASVMARLALEHVLPAGWVDEVFEAHRQQQYSRELLFSTVVELTTLVSLGLRPSLHAAARQMPALPVSLTSLYEKVNHTEPGILRALVRGSAERLGPVMAAVGRGADSLPGWRLRVLDGNHLPASEKRLAPLRGFRGAALPGQSLVVYDPDLGLVVDLLACEDAHASERAAVAPLLGSAQPGENTGRAGTRPTRPAWPSTCSASPAPSTQDRSPPASAHPRSPNQRATSMAKPHAPTSQPHPCSQQERQHPERGGPKSFKPYAPRCRSGAPFSGHMMTAIDRTAYPRPGARLSRKELDFRYDLTEVDLTFVRAKARGDIGRLLLAVLLKTRQDLGCFPVPSEVHPGIIAHVTARLGLAAPHPLIADVHWPSKLYRYHAAVRTHLGVTPYGETAERLLSSTVLDAAETMSDPADLINRAIEALHSMAVDLPGFSTLDRLVNRLRADVHERMFSRVAASLAPDDAARLGHNAGQAARQPDDRVQSPQAGARPRDAQDDQALGRTIEMAGRPDW